MRNIVLISLLTLAVVVLPAQQFSAVTPSGAVAGCPTPLAGSNILCSVTDGYYASVNGAGYVKMTAQAGGVASWNGQTGAVTYAPTKIACTTASLSTGTNGSLTASGCTIN